MKLKIFPMGYMTQYLMIMDLFYLITYEPTRTNIKNTRNDGNG